MLSFHLHYWNILSSDNHRFIIRFIPLAAKRFSCGKYKTIYIGRKRSPMSLWRTMMKRFPVEKVQRRLKNNMRSVDESVTTIWLSTQINHSLHHFTSTIKRIIHLLMFLLCAERRKCSRGEKNFNLRFIITFFLLPYFKEEENEIWWRSLAAAKLQQKWKHAEAERNGVSLCGTKWNC